MALPKLASSPAYYSLVGAHSFVLGQAAWHYRPSFLRSASCAIPQKRTFSATQAHLDEQKPPPSAGGSSDSGSDSGSGSGKDGLESTKLGSNFSLPAGWEDNPDFAGTTKFSDLPHRFFGYNQHIQINEDFKESLRQILWGFKAPIRYAFAYGSGVFGQNSGPPSGKRKRTEVGDDSEEIGDGKGWGPHPNPPKAVQDWQKGGAKVIDFIFGVSHTQHWHSMNLQQHKDHYSGLKYLPYSSGAISHIQDDFGAGVYFNPFITMNGTMIKYGVVKLDTLAKVMCEWNKLFLAGRLQKPVKILRDDPRIRYANQVNLISALRTALLMLPEKFTERQLYERIAGLSYMGDPRMNSFIASENPNKVSNIVGSQLPGFRQLYVPLIETLPNLDFTDPRKPQEMAWEKEDAIKHTGINPKLDDVLGGETGLSLTQDLDPQRRANMVRRLPGAFRKKLYFAYQKKFEIPGSAFDDILKGSEDEDPESHTMKRREGGEFERRIAEQNDLPQVIAETVRQTVAWPATSQTIKSAFTAGIGRSWKYYSEKRKKGKLEAVEPAKKE